ncbi:MAG TPA: hypothetical protein VG496_14775, partial [Myxococcales bacterium]|nr:hypothetical protein [Myxococcales bacterium]
DVPAPHRGLKQRPLAQRTRESAQLLRRARRIAMALADILAIGGEAEARCVTARAHRIEALADGNVERAATASYANEHRIDGTRKPGVLVVAPAVPAAVDAGCQTSELVEVSGVRHERRLFHDATVAKGSDTPWYRDSAEA